MTERLYYTDPYLTEFEATVVAVRQIEQRMAVVLDRTAFYPSSGGQPFDLGTLGVTRIVEVFEDENGDVVHVIDGPALSGLVAGRVDWQRRFDHMQQHTGQHVLSAAFDRSCGAATVSFHLGGEAATIDLSREVTSGEITAAEDTANAVVWEDRPVTIRFVDAEAASALPLRKEPARTGTLRIIEVEGFDVSACGGTHVARTGAIGAIAVSGWERFRGGTRVEFKCGGRGLRAHRALRDLVAAGTRLMSAAAGELPQGIERLQAENKDVRRRVKDLEARLAVFEAEAIAGRATEIAGLRVVAEAIADLDLNGLKTIAQSIVARAGHVAILATTTPPLSLVIARSADTAVDAARLLKQLTATVGGRGGGRPELAQGGGVEASPGDLLDAAKRLLASG